MIRRAIKKVNTDIIIIRPQLVSFGAMTRVQNNIMAGIIHASFVAANFAIFAK